MTEPHRTLTGPAPAVLADIVAAPTPLHAVARARELLAPARFIAVDLRSAFPSAPGRYLVAAGGLRAAWVQPDPAPAGFLVVGTHTDSPNLRVKSSPDVGVAGFVQVGVEVYGGPLLSSWLDPDPDLGLAGRVAVRSATGVDQRLVRDDRPLLRVPQLAIRLDRELSEPTGQTPRLSAQSHLTPLRALGPPEPGAVRAHVVGLLDVEAADVLPYDLMAYDTRPPAVVGRDGDLVSSRAWTTCSRASPVSARCWPSRGRAGAGGILVHEGRELRSNREAVTEDAADAAGSGQSQAQGTWCS